MLEFWHFIVPGLHVQERRFVSPFVILSTLFYLGLMFSFFFVLPFALNFLISYGEIVCRIHSATLRLPAVRRLRFVVSAGLRADFRSAAGSLPCWQLFKLGWVDAPLLKRYRKWAFLTAFIFAAILTPTPDPFNQCLMALPMYVFYEVGIVSAGIFNKKKTEAQDQALVPAVACRTRRRETSPSLPAGEETVVCQCTGELVAIDISFESAGGNKEGDEGLLSSHTAA
ncbi:MAG: twin-arginine translocase subunit TatC [Nitrospira sp.]|nr:twin-arginine translocase subunit TatC [Nitrospira sp.]